MANHQHPAEQREPLEQRITNNIKLTALTRMVNLIGGIIVVVGVPTAGLLANRYIAVLDRISARQEKNLRDFELLQAELRHTTSDIAQSNKNVIDRVELGEKLLYAALAAQSDRITAQGVALQQTISEVRDMAKYLYTKVR